MTQSMLTCVFTYYNQHENLKSTIDSYVAQNFKYGITVLILDDCSDETSSKYLVDTMKEYENKFKRIIIHRNKKNLKLLKNMQQMYDFIDTPYYSLVNIDDFLNAPLLNEAVEFLNAHENIDTYGCNAIAFDVKTNTSEVFVPKLTTDYSFSWDTRRYETDHYYLCTILRAKPQTIQAFKDMFAKITDTKFARYFRAENFRHMFHAFLGDVQVMAKTPFTYLMTSEGIWSSTDDAQRIYMNTVARYVHLKFFLSLNTERNFEYYIHSVSHGFKHYFNILLYENNILEKQLQDVKDFTNELFNDNFIKELSLADNSYFNNMFDEMIFDISPKNGENYNQAIKKIANYMQNNWDIEISYLNTADTNSNNNNFKPHSKILTTIHNLNSCKSYLENSQITSLSVVIPDNTLDLDTNLLDTLTQNNALAYSNDTNPPTNGHTQNFNLSALETKLNNNNIPYYAFLIYLLMDQSTFKAV